MEVIGLTWPRFKPKISSAFLTIHCRVLSFEFGCFACLSFYVLATSKVTSEWVPTCDSVHKCWLYSAAPLTGRPGHQHHDLISHSVILSRHWANQSLSYPNNAEHLARKWQVSIFKSLVWLDQGLNLWGLNPPISQNGTSHLVRCVSQMVRRDPLCGCQYARPELGVRSLPRKNWSWHPACVHDR